MCTKRLICLLAGFLLATAASASERIVLSGFEAPGLTPVAVGYLQKAYSSLGIELEIVENTPSRALVESTSGKTDGEVIRIGSVGDRYPTLVRVDVPLLSVVAYGYTNRADLKDKSLEDLKSLRAGHVRGAVFGEMAASGFAEVWSAEEPEQLFLMLKQKRLDLVFVRELRAKEMIERFGLEDAFSLPSSRKEYAFYHYLHERHRDLAPQVEEALRAVLSGEDKDTGDGPS
ncbi:transporter substrate-binding domain-containing protein [uncultured Roseibium sp.]|uniref:transporter substrate-binding domain-containing protein n=1 Tax=uncultured Roseibium sp. TaxID=1936171 RepID=UPI00262D985D|nr:transporter substrate-binding domain-containing protein [uncultured Roseibium sp.]